MHIRTHVHYSAEHGNAIWWHIRARNGKIFATSETYSSRAKCLQSARRVAKRCGLVLKDEKGKVIA